MTQKEYRSRPDWLGKVIHSELCKRLRFDHTNKWCILKAESVLKNEAYKIPWDFEKLIPAQRSDQVLINKKKIICHQDKIGGRIYTIHIRALLRSATLLRRGRRLAVSQNPLKET